MSKRALQGGFFLAALACGAPSLPAESPALQTEWLAGSGRWNETVRWSAGAPDPLREAAVHGTSAVLVPPGVFLAGDLEVGRRAGDRARVEVAGGQLVLLQDSLIVGESSDSEGEFVLNGGAVHCVMDVFVGAATAASGRATKAMLRIEAGSFLGRTLTVGLGFGAESRVRIEGSRAAAVHVLDNVYLEGWADPDGAPGRSTLSFVLDQNGVTPITIQSHRDGLRIIKDAVSECRLAIGLAAVPPRDDVTLVASHRPTQGIFDNLPEGHEVTADFDGRTYQWTLTYRGGASGCDVVLKNNSKYAADAPITRTRPVPEVPVPLWLKYPLFSQLPETGERAFAGAEGFGAFTPGGRGGRTVYVDNLDDSGRGSLRAALAATGARTIVFRIGGVIALRSPLVTTDPFVTLDGQAAPGAGVLLRNHGIEVRTHDVVLRHLRVRIGDDAVRLDNKNLSYAAGEGEYALDFVEGARNCIADHLSLSWSTNKILSTTKMSDLITIQWCILSESLNFAGHGYASIAGGNRVTWHHNLFAHNQSRNARFQGAVDADFRNNVIYDWGDTAAYGEFDRLNYVGNYLKAGPSTTQARPLFHSGDKVVAPGSLFVADNVMEGNAAVNQDNWRGMGYYFERASIAAAGPFPALPVATEDARVAYEHVLQAAGAILPRRDLTDQRIAREVRDGTGHIINGVAETGGWPDFPSTPPESPKSPDPSAN